jgi:hypothetical protein
VSDSLTLLLPASNLRLAKTWHANGSITPAARVKWFRGKEVTVGTMRDICRLLDMIEHRRYVAIVKEAIALGVDVGRLRRKCAAGIDEDTGERFDAGLAEVPKHWIALDIESMPRPNTIDFRDGPSLATYARALLPTEFSTAECVWQLSGSSGHPSRLDEIRLHMFFMLDEAVFPSAWKPLFARSRYVDPSSFDKGRLIFTAAPIIHGGSDPIARRHGILDGRSLVIVPKAVIERSERLASDADRIEPPTPVAPPAPMPREAKAFVDIIAASNVLRSHHPAYRNERARRLAFCAILMGTFGIVDDATLADAFQRTCVGDDDVNGTHDAQEALRWAAAPSPGGRRFSVRKLLNDASVALHKTGSAEIATRAARLAIVFGKLEARNARGGGR